MARGFHSHVPHLNERVTDMIETTRAIEFGDIVELVTSYYSWGSYSKGMVGQVVHRNNKDLVVDIAGVGQFSCKEWDVVRKEERVLKACSLTNFYTNQVDRLTGLVAQAKSDVAHCSAEREDAKECGLSDETQYDLLCNYRSAVKREKQAQRTLSCITVPDSDVFNMVKQQLESTRFECDTLSFRTKEIIIPFTMHNGVHINVPMGRFRVVCNFATRSTYFEGIGNNTRVDHRLHPHLSAGSACWGSYSSTLTQCYKTIDVSGLISLILDFLNSCDRHGWYLSVLYFAQHRDMPETRGMCPRCEYERDDCECENHCHECDNHVDDCTCNNCSECGEHMDDCQCLICPDSGERLEDDSFPDQGCMTCGHCTRNITEYEWQCRYNNSDYYSTGLDNFTPNNHNIDRHRYLTEGE